MLPIPFSNPQTYAGHSGVDYPQPRGTTFRASGPFTVVSLGRNERGGFYIWVQYKGGPLVGYHHMDSHAGCPGKGTSGNEGDRLGYVGNSGHSTGPHLHSEVNGHATTAGYWRFFDRSRVVGAASAAGTATKPASKPATPSPEPDPTWEDDDMRIFKDTSGTFWFVRPGAQIAIRGVSDLQLLRRMLNSRSTIDGKDSEALFNPREADIIRSYVS
jgi:murein DD-endopeptidase MepM/ murein hydrolase activator NlpD